MVSLSNPNRNYRLWAQFSRLQASQHQATAKNPANRLQSPANGILGDASDRKFDSNDAILAAIVVCLMLVSGFCLVILFALGAAQ